MPTNSIQIQLFPTLGYEPPRPRDQFALDSFTPTQQQRLQMVADHPTATQDTTRREQIERPCELLWNSNDPRRFTYRHVGTFLGGLSASDIEGQDWSAHELLLPPERPSLFPQDVRNSIKMVMMGRFEGAGSPMRGYSSLYSIIMVS
jgi:hypothetical protein